jgi:hypothetical protein
MRSVQKAIGLVCLTTAWSVQIARCEETISRLPDGRYLVEVNDVTVALPEEDPKNKQISFYVSTPPGASPVHFYLTDLVRDPDRCAPKLRSSEWSSVSAWTSGDHPREIIGVPVVKGVNKVGVHSGVDANCEAWQSDWARYREAAINMPADQYGWIRQDYPNSPLTSMFIKFPDGGDRRKGRYFALSCDFAGGMLGAGMPRRPDHVDFVLLFKQDPG